MRSGRKLFSISPATFFFIVISIRLQLTFATTVVSNNGSEGDSTKLKTEWSKPKKATVMSACLPGLGQVYNKKYWKLPVVYSLFTAAGYFIFNNQKKYLDFKNAIVYRYDNVQGNETYNLYSVDNLVTLKRTYRRYRDFSILGASLVYALQIVDANVDAHLLEFDVDNLSLSVFPAINSLHSKNVGFSFSIRF
jgi:Family of unknown function (DUF5683)